MEHSIQRWAETPVVQRLKLADQRLKVVQMMRPVSEQKQMVVQRLTVTTIAQMQMSRTEGEGTGFDRTQVAMTPVARTH
jgi:hypothetical protein